MPTKFGLISIGLRGLKIPDKKRDVTLRYVTLRLKLVPSQPSLAWFGLAGTELSNSHNPILLVRRAHKLGVSAKGPITQELKGGSYRDQNL